MSQTLATKEIEFDAGHRVPGHKGQCRNPHGHRYKVILKVRGYLQKEGSAEGMVLDFADIKKCLQAIHDYFDHGFIVYKDDWQMLVALGEADEHENPLDPDSPPARAVESRYGWKVAVVNFIPTAENLAEWCYQFAASFFAHNNLAGTVYKVIVYETATSAATYPA